MITIDPPSCVSEESAAGLRRALGRFLRRAREVVGLAGEVDLLLTDDAGMMRLNREFRGKRKTTDVLSFPAAVVPGMPKEMQRAGDLAISVPVAERQAGEQGHGLAAELKVLVLHGVLHLAGMDHEVDDGEMAAREGELRRRLRLPEGLIGRSVQQERRGLVRHARDGAECTRMQGRARKTAESASVKDRGVGGGRA